MLAAARSITSDRAEGNRCCRACLLQPLLGFRGKKFRSANVVLMAMAGKPRNGNSPVVFYSWVYLYARFKNRHLLDRAHDGDTPPIETAHKVFVRRAPTRNASASAGGKLVRQANKFVRKHSSADEARIVVAEVANGDRSTGTEIVVGFLLE